jgi:two-component system alkaline phosphatase synthesis response regulator PhoP
MIENKKIKILIVDDDLPLQELLKINLGSRGYVTIKAINGKEAIEKAKNERPDLVILDILMPEIDGWEVCKELRDNHDLKNIKILMLTQKDAERDKIIGTNIFKADDYIVKPFDLEELIDAAERLLDESR